MQKRFKNKVVLVTGASRGIGKAIALAFANEAAKVVVNYHASESKADEVVSSIHEVGGEAFAYKCDVSIEEQVSQMIEKIVTEFGRIDILVNNAGIVFDSSISSRSSELWQRTIDVNLKGCFLCSKYASEYMLKQKSGVIVNISSTSAIYSFSPEIIDYDASKAGVLALTKNFAKAYSPYVRVNAVAPGWVNTDINRDLPEDFAKQETDNIYLKRFGEPEEIANTVLFLASPESSFITGSTLIVDGGHD